MKWPPPTTGYWRLQQNRRTVMQSAIVIHTPCTVNLSTEDLSRHKSTAEYSQYLYHDYTHWTVTDSYISPPVPFIRTMEY